MLRLPPSRVFHHCNVATGMATGSSAATRPKDSRRAGHLAEGGGEGLVGGALQQRGAGHRPACRRVDQHVAIEIATERNHPAQGSLVITGVAGVVAGADGPAPPAGRGCILHVHVDACPEPGGSARCYWNGYGTQCDHPARAQGLAAVAGEGPEPCKTRVVHANAIGTGAAQWVPPGLDHSQSPFSAIIDHRTWTCGSH